MRVLLTIVLALSLTGCVVGPDPQDRVQQLDLVLSGGRVIDPESGTDGVFNVGIRGGRIVEVSSEPLSGLEVVDVSGRVVAPGFINLHSHAWTPLGNRFELQDGVTTALELEAGAYPVASYGTHEPIALENRAHTNFGASLGHAFVRSSVIEAQPMQGGDHSAALMMQGKPATGLDGPAFTRTLDTKQRTQLRQRLQSGLRDGGLGIGVLLDYMNEVVDDAELRMIFDVAASAGAPVFIHIRRGIAGDPAGLNEVIDLARQTGARVHICHLQSLGMMNTARFMALVRDARASGVDITMESFPYNAGSTSISAAVFSRDWQRIFAIGFEDVEWVETGERLTEESWNRYRREQPGGSVVHHYNREAWTREASIAPDVIVAADGTPVISLDVKNAPFGIGTFSRIYARYVRKEGSLSLMDAVSKMTLLPARVLEDYSPAFKQKGRIQPGADADITVFGLARIQDNATFQEPFRPSTGIDHVIVCGEFALRDGAMVAGSFPGRRILK